MNDDDDIQFIVSTGDLTSSGTISEIKTYVKKTKRLNVPLYTTMGNHDAFDS
ncbi:MAG: metallophosphoesterase [Spirochaetes bacterium]|jgi:predicted phosphodiesterase|nr:metallophosphoesterase [Spirochaetota bacterium]